MTSEEFHELLASVVVNYAHAMLESDSSTGLFDPSLFEVPRLLAVEACEAAPDDPRPWFMLGECMAPVAPDEAIPAYERALELCGGEAVVAFHLGTLLIRLDRTDDGLAALRTAARSKKGHLTAWLAQEDIDTDECDARARGAPPEHYYSYAYAFELHRSGRTKEAAYMMNQLHRKGAEFKGEALGLVKKLERWESAERARARRGERAPKAPVPFTRSAPFVFGMILVIALVVGLLGNL